MDTQLIIHLLYRDEPLSQAWQSNFAGIEGVVVQKGDITKIACDAVVSPANAFGFMDGGLDAALSHQFGWNLQTEVQARIRELPEREMLIGSAIIVPTRDRIVPWLIVAPTMRVPMSYQIAKSINAYLAMKAILLAVAAHPEITVIAIPGLCTGVGRMPPETAARQMFLAYDEVVRGNWPEHNDFGDTQRRHLEINPTGMIWDF